LSNNYQVLALKWRPKHFKDVVGQDHITATLQKAFEKNRLAQAFLFAGPRGVGKTTMARLVAMSLNGSDKPTVEYDINSDAIKDIIEGRSMDVIEIDGASNRGIDEIRELRENIKFMPVASSYKVVIIDEVHMLTVQAFNALLKTLEEPPKHVKFILATTDVHKVPQTIISRCQRFDFLPLTNKIISERLAFISKEESHKIETQSLLLIASKSEGSMRDALSYLDQVLVLGDNVPYQTVQDLLGIVPTEVLFNLSDALDKKDGDKLIDNLEMIRNKGYIVEDLLKDLIIHFRNLSVVKFKNGLKLIGLEPELARKYSESSYSWSDKDIIRLSNNLSSLYATIKQYSDQYLLLEMQLIKLLQFDSSIDIENFLKEENTNLQQTKKVEAVEKPLKKTEKVISELKKIESIQSEDLKSNWEIILKSISKKRGSIGAQLSGCLLGQIKNNTIELISYDNSEFNQKLLNESLPLLKSVIDEKFNSNVKIDLIIDTQVEKIENEDDNKVNENDIVNLFEGKDML
jgi:DNA polymerase-3 subunit gamma/tau